MTTIVPQAKSDNKAAVKEASNIQASDTQAVGEAWPDATLFGTPEEEQKDENAWNEQFAATPDDKLNKLMGIVQSKIRAGNSSPLDFTDK